MKKIFLRAEAEGTPLEYDDECVSGLSYGENAGQLQMQTASPQSLQVAPNPVSETLTVYLPKDFNETEVLIADIYGRTVRTVPVNGDRRLYIETHNWPSGVYFLSAGNSLVTKIIISH